jgi:site-specific DNA-methyltransferase (cytosine-N4-specific)
MANTESNGSYQQRCRAAGIKVHPARFPSAFPEFFIKFLTNEGDTVLDPFAGSNTTGYAAERLRRRWIACELSEEYLRGSKFRFDLDVDSPQLRLVRQRVARYGSQVTKA